jgi:hypothetical protein
MLCDFILELYEMSDYQMPFIQSGPEDLEKRNKQTRSCGKN